MRYYKVYYTVREGAARIRKMWCGYARDEWALYAALRGTEDIHIVEAGESLA
jgi:hypothetical protein